MKRFGMVMVVLVLVLMASTVMAGVQKSLVVGVFPSVGGDMTSVELRVSEVAPVWGNELSLGYLGGLKVANQDNGWERYSAVVGKTYKKSEITFFGGTGLVVEEFNKVANAYLGFYGGAKIDLSKDLFVDGKFTKVIDGQTSGWQFGVGLNF